MTTIFDAAMRNFRAAADILEALQATRLDMVAEARSGLVGRPRLGLAGGYNNVTPNVGVCLPTSARAEFLMAENASGVELRCTGADWMTLEGTLPAEAPMTQCYLEMQVSAERPVVADVFLREFLEDGSVRDAGHRECQMTVGAVTVCMLNLPEASDDTVGRRVIVHLRQPAPRMILDRLAVTLA
ncbi:hypothetical protein [Paracoccus shanxieyensis]|uniref:Uncharacterized protein n=1 Tax=Paracoccus shanxieyensis TaxID=2675752 RepID=A0A6L6IVJ3_9RHOB|nr:hypothetical protein [Paracoccus shanxieyensis]MTH63070.1 hypothetical protein [Paracoccus shanxieyensis]MTH88963.1 hypothetical protein [Paracoccus shanxieyensis]